MTEAALRETEFLDWSAPEVGAFVELHAPASLGSARERAVSLYYAVRDTLLYEIYGARFDRPSLRASSVLRRGAGLCIHKSVVYAAALRHIGVPSKLCLMDVRNHLCSPKLRQYVGGDVFHYHGLVALHLDGHWLRATPVFNARLCSLYGMAPLEFDGTADSVHHPFDQSGRRHMEIVREHGSFDDLPYTMILNGLRSQHPNIFSHGDNFVRGSLRADARQAEGKRAS